MKILKIITIIAIISLLIFIIVMGFIIYNKIITMDINYFNWGLK